MLYFAYMKQRSGNTNVFPDDDILWSYAKYFVFKIKIYLK